MARVEALLDGDLVGLGECKSPDLVPEFGGSLRSRDGGGVDSVLASVLTRAMASSESVMLVTKLSNHGEDNV